MAQMDELISTELMMDYLGADADSWLLIDSIRLSAIDRLNTATGRDWRAAESDIPKANAAIRCMVWLDFYAIRDDSKNTAHIEAHLAGLITELQLIKESS